MSGQPYRYAKDIENFRDNYMEALGLRANLDDMNLQANKIYKETGTIPPKSTAMKDTRTTAEILMDTEKLKIGLVGELKSVCSPQMAMLVIQRVISSPLNADGSFLIWFSQNAPELVTNLKKKYKFGIAGNDNDAEQMVLFLQTAFSRTKDMSTSVKTAFDRPAGSGTLGVEVGDFVALGKAFSELYLRLISKMTLQSPMILDNIRDRFTGLNKVLNSPSTRYKDISEHFNMLSHNLLLGQQAQVNSLGFSEWLEYTDKIPSPSSVRTLIDQLDKASRNQNPELSRTILQSLESILPSLQSSNDMYDITNNIMNFQRRDIRSAMPVTRQPQLNVTGGPPPPPPIGAPSGAPPFFVAPPMGGDVANIANTISGMAVQLIHQLYYNDIQTRRLGDGLIQHSIPFNVSRHISVILGDRMDAEEKRLIKYSAPQMEEAIRKFTGNDLFKTQNIINGRSEQQFIDDEFPSFNKTIRGTTGYSMTGFGLHKKRVGRPKGSGLVKPLSERIDRTKGVTQGNTHVPFGKYIINKNKLENDVVSFKHNKGYRIAGYPMKKVSSNFGSVMRTIAGGGIPKFEDFNRLSEEEKDYLHKVSEKAGILDKLSIPQPSKDKLEQDIHQFEVMKGEILAGNDSPEVIKKFKLILLKLTKTGTIPKREGMEMMEELLSLGF